MTRLIYFYLNITATTHQFEQYQNSPGLISTVSNATVPDIISISEIERYMLASIFQAFYRKFYLCKNEVHNLNTLTSETYTVSLKESIQMFQ